MFLFENKPTFAKMNLMGKIFLNLILLVTILLNFEMTANPNHGVIFQGIEQPTSGSSTDNYFNKDIDSASDDQISPLTQINLVIEPEFQLFLSQNYKLLFTPPISIWQPPEVS
jgi:hypothetical protein